MAYTQIVKSDQVFDSAIGGIKVQQSVVLGFDVDDFVTSTVESIANTIKMYNLAVQAANDPNSSQNRNIVSISGVTVGGY